MDVHLQKAFQAEVKRATGKPHKKNGSKKNPLLNENREAVRVLARRECANCNGGYCLPADKPCNPITARGELCAYFRDCVLPLDKVLQAKVTAKAYKQRDRIKPCAACGKTFFASGNARNTAKNVPPRGDAKATGNASIFPAMGHDRRMSAFRDSKNP